MNAQVVFDLPLDGPFDYSIPEHLLAQLTVGTRVKVSFGPRPRIGFVTGLSRESDFLKLKPVLSLCDASAIFNSLDLTFAQDFAAYYGCSLGEALATILRNKGTLAPSIHRDNKPALSLHRCSPDGYRANIQKIIDGYQEQSQFLILVPDTFRLQVLTQQLKGIKNIRIGMRSSVFEADGRFGAVIMVDDEDSSYKQEQTPMYETRQVLMARSRKYGFDVVFVGVSPSVELMGLVREGQVALIDSPDGPIPPARLVDLTNYKFVPGLISPPVRDALEAALKTGKKSILVLNRRGSYRLTRCVECAGVLKCGRCDSPLLYSRTEGKYLCRHCTYTAPGDTVCPHCRKPSWKSVGIGVEKVQAELKKLFPQARVAAFERAVKTARQSLPDFDILISTNAVQRFQGTLKVQVAAFIDFDAEINRLDMRSAFNAVSLARHISSMAIDPVFIQTRHINHYVLQCLSRGNMDGFYDEELKLRKEFGFSPFKHWIKISWRGKIEKSVQEAAVQVYNVLNLASLENKFIVTPPLADAVGRKREQFRVNVMVQADHVPQAVSFIKSTLAQIKRPSRVIVTLNIDP